MKKAALLIGINYVSTSYELSGCITDVNNIENLLKNNLEFTEITKVTDNHIKPSKNNILNEFDNILKKINNGYDEVWIHYSGHGYRVYDNSGDESDNYDEVIIPLDYQSSGVINDDYLNKNFLKKITNPNCKLFIFFDCCNSGTQMDLKWQYKNNSWKQISDKTCLGQVLFMSGCRDDQESSEMYNIMNDKKWAGAMTSSFIKYIKDNNYNITIIDLITNVTEYIHSTLGSTQIPQICCNYHINIDAYFIRNNMVGGTNLDKKNVNDVFNKYIHIYKRYEHLCEKYKNSLVFYNYYTKMRDLYKNTIDNFVNVDHQIINQTNNIETFFEI